MAPTPDEQDHLPPHAALLNGRSGLAAKVLVEHPDAFPPSPAAFLDQFTTLDLEAPIAPIAFLDTPTFGERPLFYAVGSFTVSGMKKAGKSWCELLLSRDVLRHSDRHVYYVDLEQGRDLILRRLKQLKLTPDEAARFHYAEFPTTGLSRELIRSSLEAIAERHPGALVILDSFGSLFGLMLADVPNKSVNDQQNVRDALDPIQQAAVKLGLCIGIIDHATKTGSKDAEFSTAGSAHKEAAVGAVYFWTKEAAFSRRERGTVSLKPTSDRQGELPTDAQYYAMGGQGANPDADEYALLHFEPVDRSNVGAAARVREEIVQVLRDAAPEAMTKTAVRERVDGTNATKGEILEALAADGDSPIRPVRGPNGATHYAYIEDQDLEQTNHILKVGI